MRDVKKLLLLGMLPLLAIAPALSQSGAAPKGKAGSNAPVDVGAERIEVQDRANRAILTGNVVATQGNMTMNSARLTVIYANTPHAPNAAAGSAPAAGSGTVIQRLEASGGVRLRTPTETARSEFAIYDVPRRLVTMIGAVNLDQGANHVQGGRLVLDLDTHRAVVDGGAAGSQSRGGRVTGHFIVPPRQGSPSN
jgi:lipopolysaccharide export system protein LptA